MARQKANWLAGDTRRAAQRIQTALNALAKIGLDVDDPNLRLVEGDLAAAINMLNVRADYFERHGQDYEHRDGNVESLRRHLEAAGWPQNSQRVPQAGGLK